MLFCTRLLGQVLAIINYKLLVYIDMANTLVAGAERAGTS